MDRGSPDDWLAAGFVYDGAGGQPGHSLPGGNTCGRSRRSEKGDRSPRPGEFLFGRIEGDQSGIRHRVLKASSRSRARSPRGGPLRRFQQADYVPRVAPTNEGQASAASKRGTIIVLIALCQERIHHLVVEFAKERREGRRRSASNDGGDQGGPIGASVRS